jgi:FemAB-related protein (PEP-CTERM system-associated)
MERATELAREVGAHWLELRHEAAVDWPLAVRQHKVSMRLALPPDPEDLFRSFSTKHRTRIRRAKKEKMTVRFGKLEEVDSFYRVFCRNMRDLGTPVYPRRFFEKLTEVFSERTHILTVYDGSSPVASGLVMGFKDRLEIPWASSIREYNHLRVNILLYWAVLEYACKQGYRVFDFGRTTPGSGTYDFKEQWGAKPMPLYWYYWLAPGQRVPDMSPQNPKYQLAIRLWQKLPLGLTNAIGPVISKHLP